MSEFSRTTHGKKPNPVRNGGTRQPGHNLSLIPSRSLRQGPMKEEKKPVQGAFGDSATNRKKKKEAIPFA